MIDIAERIKNAREKRGLSQNALAKKAGVAQATINAIERQTKNPSVETLMLIADALDVSVNSLLGKEDIDEIMGLTLDEKQIIHLYRLLPDTGKEKAFRYLLFETKTIRTMRGIKIKKPNESDDQDEQSDLA